MNSLIDIIQRCHHRHQKPLRQQKTVPTPAMVSRDYLHQYTVYCARKYPLLLDDLEQAGISVMPTGWAPEHDGVPKGFQKRRFMKRQGMQDWSVRRWNASWGIHIYTGIPSERDGARWHDLDFKYEALCTAPDAISTCIETLVNAVANPLLTMTKSGGLRFSCRVENYLHPNAEEERLYIYRHTPTAENPHHRDVHLEIFGENGYSRWDARYEILLGDLLNPPVISKEVLFAPIDALRAKLHEPVPQDTKRSEFVSITLPSFGSRDLDLAKEALLMRGFSYVRQENGFHHWIRYGGEVNNTDLLLWESDGTVWVRTSTPEAGLPVEATPITDVLGNIGIVPPATTLMPPVSDKVLIVREGKLSPLAIRRPSPVLHKSETTEQVDKTLEKNSVQIQRALDGTARILGLIVETDEINNYEIESHLLNSSSICLTRATAELAEAAEQRFQNRNVSSVARWKPRRHRWEQVKEIPVDVRMANPFQHGNVCEDPERCDALEEKGADPSESICPQCPVYTVCQERGYLSQPTALKHAKVQILTMPRLFLDPQYAELVEKLFERRSKAEERVCLVDEAKIHSLFLKCELSKDVLEEWVVNWQGNALGNFAKTMLNALEIRGKSHGAAVKRIRATMQAFEWQEKEIIRQMCQVNVPGRIVARGLVDAETGKELARFTIEFQNGVSAYIPLDNSALDILIAKGLPFFQPHSFDLNEDIRLPMSMAQAIQLGILDVETIEGIQEFPTVCPNPNWTFWHQFKHFFRHYTRNDDAPVRWDSQVLMFKFPPVLHPSVKRLLLRSTTLSEAHLRRAFPTEEIEVNRIEPTPWRTENQVFQIRTGLYTNEAILDYSGVWSVGISEIGQRFFHGIQAEIEKDSSVKHAIFAHSLVSEKLAWLIETKNVSFVNHSRRLHEADAAFEAAGVIWIVGTPVLQLGPIWQRAQIFFGNDETPFNYERETKPYHYKDERIQSVYEAAAVSMLTQAVELIQLNHRTGKKVILIAGLELPGITDRPETMLFDWEDFEVAGRLDKLAETITTRQHFETEKANLTAESGRDKVQQVLGCSTVHANRVLRDLRGGSIQRVTFREQIHSILADGEKKAAEVVAAIDGNPKAVRHELVRLANIGEIEKVRWGVYALRKNRDIINEHID